MPTARLGSPLQPPCGRPPPVRSKKLPSPERLPPTSRRPTSCAHLPTSALTTSEVRRWARVREAGGRAGGGAASQPDAETLESTAQRWPEGSQGVLAGLSATRPLTLRKGYVPLMRDASNAVALGTPGESAPGRRGGGGPAPGRRQGDGQQASGEGARARRREQALPPHGPPGPPG